MKNKNKKVIVTRLHSCIVPRPWTDLRHRYSYDIGCLVIISLSQTVHGLPVNPQWHITLRHVASRSTCMAGIRHADNIDEHGGYTSEIQLNPT